MVNDDPEWSPGKGDSHVQAYQVNCPYNGGRGAGPAGGGQLTNYKGTKYGFSGYFTTSRLIMTGPGSVTEANAGPLNSTANAFSTYLVP